MAQFTVHSADLGGLSAFVRRVARFLRRLALLDLAAVALIVAALARGGFGVADAVVAIVLLAPAAILLFFGAGLLELMKLPERLRRMPTQGAEQLAELNRIAGDARGASWSSTPGVLWRLRGLAGSTRDLVGFALPLRIFTPGFLGLTLLAGFASTFLIFAGLIALVVLVAG